MTSFEGAEATVTINDTVEKKRHEKKYRHPELDQRIRTERTSSEARILRKALRAGVNVPELLEESEDTIKLEKVNGKMLKQVIATNYMEQLGLQVAKLHENGIIHGDLTTSNAIVNSKVFLIDFGLSFSSDRLEDLAVDLHLLKQVLNSSHSENAEELWKAFIEGYSQNERFDEVMERLEDVEQRGRYK